MRFITGLIIGIVITVSIGIDANTQTMRSSAKQESNWQNTLNLVNSIKHDIISFELLQRGETEALKQYYQQSLNTGFTLLEKIEINQDSSDKYILTSIKELESWRRKNPIQEIKVENQLPLQINSELFPSSGGNK
jgi:hypothetical protein